MCRLSEAGRQHTLQMWVTKVEAPGKDGVSLRTLMRGKRSRWNVTCWGWATYKPYARSV